MYQALRPEMQVNFSFHWCPKTGWWWVGSTIRSRWHELYSRETRMFSQLYNVYCSAMFSLHDKACCFTITSKAYETNLVFFAISRIPCSISSWFYVLFYLHAGTKQLQASRGKFLNSMINWSCDTVIEAVWEKCPLKSARLPYWNHLTSEVETLSGVPSRPQRATEIHTQANQKKHREWLVMRSNFVQILKELKGNEVAQSTIPHSWTMSSPI